MDYSIYSGFITCCQIFKCHFLQDISDSCHEVTAIGREPTQKNFCEKISIFLGASPSQSLDIKEGAADAQVVLWPKFFCHLIRVLSQTTGENFKKIRQTVSDLQLI